MIIRPAIIAVFIALAAMLSPELAFAQQDRSSTIDEARSAFTELRQTVESGDIDDVASLEDRIRLLRDEARNRLAAIDRELEVVMARRDALGPAPAETDPAESADLAAERATLNEELARLNSQKTRVNANIIEANELLARLSAGRIETLYTNLATRGASPLSPAMWRPAATSASQTWDKISAYFDEWGEKRRAGSGLGSSLIFVGLAFFIALFLFWPVNRWIMRTFSVAIKKHEASPARRVLVAGLKMLARAIPGLIGGFIIMETLRAQGILTEEGETPARALWFGLIIYLLISGFLSGLLAPANPSWRIAQVEASRGRVVSFLINTIVLIFGVKILLIAILSSTGAATELTQLIDAVSAIVVSILLFLSCRSRLWRSDEITADNTRENTAESTGENLRQTEDATLSQGWRIVRRTGRAFAIVTALAALAGYIDLAEFAASRLYYLSIILAFAWFVRAILLEFGAALWRRRGEENESTDDETEQKLSNFRFWNSLVVNTLLIIAAAPAVFVLAGVPNAAVLDGLRQALFGFTIGGVAVPSLARILFAILIFVAIMIATRFFQRGIRTGPFAHSNIDVGVQNSLVTLVGYAGLLIALFGSISAIGFDLSNLALIAGALSVGIGFGLQSIVNNFVSGLILLFERPIKVGDWIVTTSGEGTVKKISVRSTEIETFDRSSIIVPNSELISSTVTNWTHRSKLGRVVVPVGVAYGSDVEMVKEILLSCARQHPQIMRYPEPFVTWQDFGASSLDFDLRAYLSDISTGLTVRTELRFAIYNAFKQAGIEIPFPQRDVHVKSWPDNELKKRPENQNVNEFGASDD